VYCLKVYYIFINRYLLDRSIGKCIPMMPIHSLDTSHAQVVPMPNFLWLQVMEEDMLGYKRGNELLAISPLSASLCSPAPKHYLVGRVCGCAGFLVARCLLRSTNARRSWVVLQ
jgi:hypothetical protein